jgi:hypothetical protein
VEKVKLPKEVAEAIVYLRSKGEMTADIIINSCGNANSQPYTVLRAYADTPKNLERLAHALINGFEVEQTPEDKVREIYEKAGNELDSMYMVVFRNGVHKTLDALGIKIEGVNA